MIDNRKEFNNDNHVAEMFLTYAKRNNASITIETGSYHGITTRFLSDHFDRVISIESNESFLNIAKENAPSNKIEWYLNSSEKILPEIFKTIDDDENVIFFLDAHYGNYCPLLDELALIAKHRNGKDAIVIHDFKVPNNSQLRYDTYYDQPLSLEYINESLKRIFPNGFKYEYNSKLCGLNRGVIFIESN